jgi:biopolymer transport protein ExbD
MSRDRHRPRRKLSHADHGAMHELNITPLLDLVFVLLVIFIITTPQLANDLEMNLPSGKRPTADQKPPKIHRIVVATDGALSMNQQPVQLAQLKDLFAALKKEDAEAAVVVSGSADVDYQRIISVLDLLQQADLNKVGLATETAR